MNYEDYSQWLEDYEAPEIDSIIVGYSGIDPDKKVKAEAINHERLDGLLGGDWAGHYHLTNDQVAKLESYQKQIDDVRTEANNKISTVAKEANEKIASLREEALSEIARVEASTEQQITTLDEKVTETRDEITSRMTDIESSQSSLETKQELIETRFDEVLEGVTEDSEILDARVDAEAVTHKNLGSNIRNLHNLIKQQDEHIQGTAEELRGLLRQEISEEAQERTVNDLELAWQVNKNAEANIENSLAVSQEAQTRRKGFEKANERIDSLDDENEARKREIQSEARERAGQDNEIREQIFDERISRLQVIARLDNENEARKREINDEADERKSNDSVLQYQADSLALSKLREALVHRKEREALRYSKKQEHDSRISDENFLQGEIDTLGKSQISQAISLKALNEKHRAEAQARQEKDNELRQDLAAESLARQAADDSLQEKLTAEQVARTRADNDETFARINRDDVLQSQADQLAFSQIKSVIAQNKERASRIEADNAEIQQRLEYDEVLQAQIDAFSSAIIQSAASFRKAIDRRKEDLEREILARLEDNAELQKQSDDNAAANINNALNIQREAEKRREDLSEAQRQLDERLEQCDYLQAQSDRLVEAVLRVCVNLNRINEIRRNALEQEIKTRQEQGQVERQSREENDAELQKQSDDNAAANINNALNIQREAERRRTEISDANRRIDQQKEKSGLDDEVLQGQINFLISAIIQNAINLHKSLNRQGNALKTETEIRQSENAGILDQIHLLALSNVREALNFRQAGDIRRRETLTEIQTRSEQDESLQDQINELAETSMRQMIYDMESRQRIIAKIEEVKQTIESLYDDLADSGIMPMTYKGAKVARTQEVHDMLADVLAGNDDGEISESVIPEELQGEISTHEEVSEMLDEVLNP